MSANVDGMIRAAVDAFKRGNRAEARTLLEKATELDEMNEQAWLWLGAVVDDPIEQRTCLENVLVINPNNERAKKGLQSLGVDITQASSPATSPSSDEFELTSAAPFTDMSFADDDDFTFSLDEDETPPAPAPTEPPAREVTIPTSSASANFDDSFSTNDYDSWMDNLNLPGAQQEGEYSENTFGFDDTTDFDTTTGFEEVEQESGSFYGSDDYGTMFGDVDDDVAAHNPVNNDPAYDFVDYAAADVDEFKDVLGKGYDDDDLFASYGDDETDQSADRFEDFVETDDHSDFDEIFRLIPVAIKPTRVPGKQQGRSPVRFLLTALLIIANLIMAGLLVTNLT